MQQLSLLAHSQGLSGIELVANAFRNSEDFCCLCDAVYSGVWLPMFRRNLLFPSSGYKITIFLDMTPRIWYIGSNVSEEYTASIFRMSKAAGSSKLVACEHSREAVTDPAVKKL
jgi:hypothetical protein